MEEKRIIIRIRKDGSIQASSRGIKGKKCMRYLPILEEILKADIVDSGYTEEYYEKEAVLQQKEVQKYIKVRGRENGLDYRVF